MTASAAAKADRIPWLILSYQLRGGQSLRATIRRRLTAVGAVFPAPAIAALPASPPAERALRRIRKMISEAGGSAQVLRGEVLEGAPQLAEAFNNVREQEYAKIVTECAHFVVGLETLTAAGQFRYSDLAGKEADLDRLCARRDAIQTFDLLGAANAQLAHSAVANCDAVLNDFAACDYQTDNIPGGGTGHRSPARDAP
jgi:hypothetical protein